MPTTRPPHPERAAAEARAALITRSDNNWATYGFTPTEVHLWQHHGIPTDKAHWAAMCRDTTTLPNRAHHLTPDRLQRPLNAAGTTALDELRKGRPLTRALARIPTTGRPLEGIPETLIALTAPRARGYGNNSTRHLAHALRHMRIHDLPAIADQIIDEARRLHPLTQARTNLARDIDTYLTTDHIGDTLRTYAQAHGIYRPGPELYILATTTPDTTTNDLHHGTTTTQLLTTAATARHYTYIPPQTLAATSDYLYADPAPTPPPHPLPPHGIALIGATDLNDDTRLPRRLLSWTSDGTNIHATLITTSNIPKTLQDPTTTTANTETWTPAQGPTQPGSPARHVHLLNHLTHTAPPPRTTTPNPTTSPHHHTRHDVILTYTPTTTPSTTQTPTTRTTPTHRWRVRGHWRHQWHPSTNTHKPIWIHEHTSGPANMPLITRDHITVITPRTHP